MSVALGQLYRAPASRMPEALRHDQLLGGEEVGAFEMRFVHQVRGPGF